MRRNGRAAIDMAGKTCHGFTVMGKAESKSRDAMWRCRCACGNIAEVSGSDLRRGHKKYCGKCPERDEKARLSPIRTLYNNYKRRARRADLAFELTIAEFENLIIKACYYCDDPPRQLLRKKGSRFGVTYNGLDRADNSKGYTLNNVRPSCKFCNLAKSRWPESDFLAWLNRLKAGVLSKPISASPTKT